MTPNDLLGRLIHTAYVTYTHNQLVIAYFSGFVITGILAIWKPSRFTILLLLGFGVLGFGYEYDKHLVGPLTRQTLQSLIEDPGMHQRTQRYTNIFLGEVVPIGLYMLGWGMMFLGIFVGTKDKSSSQNGYNTPVTETVL